MSRTADLVADSSDVRADLLDELNVPGAEELIVQSNNQVRQAGATQAEGAWVDRTRLKSERSLFVFGKGILSFTLLTQSVHLLACRWLQQCPPFRKLFLMPRDTFKTTIMRMLVLHMLIQPRSRNVYFPGCQRRGCAERTTCADDTHRKPGNALRILYAGETIEFASKQLLWVMHQLESNDLLRALWPHLAWENPNKDARAWSAKALFVPRPKDYDFPEGSLEAIGVGGAVVGRHFDVIGKDDIATFNAANSPAAMQEAIDWHITSRSLFDDPDRSLEFISGTKWGIHDVYYQIMETDPTVEIYRRSLEEEGGYPFEELGFGKETCERLKREFGVMYALLYLNEARDPSLTDFAEEDLRRFTLDETTLVFDSDGRDQLLQRQMHERHAEPVVSPGAGLPLTSETYGLIARRGEYLKFKAT